MSFTYCNFVKFSFKFLVLFGLISSDFLFTDLYVCFSGNWLYCISSELFRAELLNTVRCNMKTEGDSCSRLCEFI